MGRGFLVLQGQILLRSWFVFFLRCLKVSKSREPTAEIFVPAVADRIDGDVFRLLSEIGLHILQQFFQMQITLEQDDL